METLSFGDAGGKLLLALNPSSKGDDCLYVPGLVGDLLKSTGP